MDPLTKVIGLAPSELSSEELQGRIRLEHQRVSQGFLEPRTYKGKKVGAKKKAVGERKPTQKAKALVAKELEQVLGISIEELLAKEKEE